MRVDNPILVMANEVEPLISLQRVMRGLAWQPAFRIRHKISEYLKNKELIDFEKDYEMFYIEGESKSKHVGRPFLLRGASRETGVLLVHGYMAAPLEVTGLANILPREAYGFTVPA